MVAFEPTLELSIEVAHVGTAAVGVERGKNGSIVLAHALLAGLLESLPLRIAEERDIVEGDVVSCVGIEIANQLLKVLLRSRCRDENESFVCFRNDFRNGFHLRQFARLERVSLIGECFLETSNIVLLACSVAIHKYHSAIRISLHEELIHLAIQGFHGCVDLEGGRGRESDSGIRGEWHHVRDVVLLGKTTDGRDVLHTHRSYDEVHVRHHRLGEDGVDAVGRCALFLVSINIYGNTLLLEVFHCKEETFVEVNYFDSFVRFVFGIQVERKDDSHIQLRILLDGSTLLSFLSCFLFSSTLFGLSLLLCGTLLSQFLCRIRYADVFALFDFRLFHLRVGTMEFLFGDSIFLTDAIHRSLFLHQQHQLASRFLGWLSLRKRRSLFGWSDSGWG